MFTGIVEAVGSVLGLEPCHADGGHDKRLWLQMGVLDLSSLKLGDSIAVSGACLTVVASNQQGHCAFDVSEESLVKTALGQLRVGDAVNLETALTLQKPLGGHLVSGHVDAVGQVVALEPKARSMQVLVRVPEHLAHYLAVKGSITLDGISLTINAKQEATCTVNIVPHTQVATTVKNWQVGYKINVEVDLLARYIESILEGCSKPANPSKPQLTQAFLQAHGFASE